MPNTHQKTPTVRDPWPFNPFVTSIRIHGQDIISNTVNQYETESGFRVSMFDLALQVMLVACSHEPSEVWQTQTDDVRIASELVAKGSAREASELLEFALENKSITLNTDLIQTIARQQAERLHRLHKLPSYRGKPLAYKKSPSTFDTDAELAKLKNDDTPAEDTIYHATAIEKRSGKKVIFRPVSLELSKACAETFHYLHTGRSDDVIAFGVFLPEETVPFAWVAYGTVDRKYKQSMMKAAGLDHTRALELTRAWNHESSPKNTMSMLYAYAHGVIQRQWPARFGIEPHAILTAVNPNLGFRGSAFRAVGFGVIGEKPTKYHYLLHSSGHRSFLTRRDLEEFIPDKPPTRPKQLSSMFPLLGTKELAVILHGSKRLRPTPSNYYVDNAAYKRH